MDNRVACEWGTYIPSGTQRVNKRAFFLLDEENRIRYSHDITLKPSGFDLVWILSNLDSILGDPPPEPAPWDGPIPEEEEMPTGEIPAPGEEAPDFEVMESHMNPVALQDFRGRRVVLLFYQHDYSLACSELLLDYASQRGEFEKRDTVVLAINRDNPYTHRAFAKEFGFNDSHLLSDMNGAVARRWGLFVGGAERAHKKAVFLLDEKGRVLWSEVLKTQESLLPAREILAKLDELAD
ncbi:MAG: redoxin domain-containing protein [Candidatus Krumholzibacteria bacterium]|jgi:peroxiredoxin|nr:redoxin domain-containing protein [Candidatus Krumholzibacteria bacterium]MDP6668412.1 redoxin domain-containing protein [Candidatus Krumholzibacteria bacterium]MDP6797981.1 redoxin domain-containing protein [Candidatus Krumholzibacteria bacterium]MDP7021864.1 redoxin domain-containing protein [Candidatus Krumholzibacteria bacterium]